MIARTLLCLLLSLSAYSQTAIPFSSISNSGGGTIQNTTSKIIGTFGQGIAVVSSTSLQSGFIPSVNVYINNGAPRIEIKPALPSVVNTGDAITVSVDDNDVDSVVIYYRPIAGTTFIKETMVAADANYSVNVSSAWMDLMGTEYYFRAVDKTRKETRSPEKTQEYYHSYAKQTLEFVPASVYKKGGKDQKDYRIITVPDTLLDASIGTQFGELNGEYDKSIYRIASYAGNDQWKEFPDIASFERGRGYWFLTVKNDQITIENSQPPANYQSHLFEMTLQPGWNQIGNPYTLPISWENVKTFNSGIKIKTVKVYNEGSFGDGDVLQPYQGAFAYLDESSSKQIQIPFQGQTSSGRAYTYSTDLADENWKLDLKLIHGDAVNTTAAIGMSPEALTTSDALDDFSPPHFADYTEIEFAHPEHPQKFFVKDFVPKADEYVWPFTVNASSAESIKLAWNNQNLGDNNLDLYLLDEQQSRLVNMRDFSSYTVIPKSSYKIYYGQNVVERIRPDKASVGKSYPNPLSLTQQTKISIPFALPGQNEEHHVQLQIFDSKGQPVRYLLNTTLNSGYYEATWDGSDYREQVSAAGLYLYKLNVKGKTESTFTGKIFIIN